MELALCLGLSEPDPPAVVLTFLKEREKKKRDGSFNKNTSTCSVQYMSY